MKNNIIAKLKVWLDILKIINPKDRRNAEILADPIREKLNRTQPKLSLKTDFKLSSLLVPVGF